MDQNQLEPKALVDAFLQHPPTTFEVNYTSKDIAFFTTSFNLLTTLDVPVRKKIEALPGYTWWKGLIHWKTCFIGTTVTEYTPINNTSTPEELVKHIKGYVKQFPLTIIKDLPVQSPLLTDAENNYSQTFMQLTEQQGFFCVEGQALAYVPIDFNDREDYLSRLSKSRRKNLKRKLKNLALLDVEIANTGDERFAQSEFRNELYDMYFQVYQQSDIHFDLLTPAFFDQILQDTQSNGRVFLYWHHDELVGYNICYQYRDCLIDKYIGFHYPKALAFDLYFNSWFVNLDYAQQHHLKYYIAGWTDPEVKAQLGAKFTFTRHLVWVRQPILAFVLRKFKHIFESDNHWHQQAGHTKT